MFHERLRQLRKQRGVTQDELAERAGINRSYLSAIENGHSSPTIDVVEQLAKGLGVNVWELLSTVEEKHFTYEGDDEYEMFDGLRQFLEDPDEMMLAQPTAEEIDSLKKIDSHSGFKPDKRFFRDALLALRRVRKDG
jgi:transcriptional regulator with XRE-family HTH domain